MLRMLRFRRYRVFLIFAALIAILLVRFSRTSSWDRYGQIDGTDISSFLGNGERKSTPPNTLLSGGTSENKQQPQDLAVPNVYSAELEDKDSAQGAKPHPEPISTEAQSESHIVLPDRKVSPPTQIVLDSEEDYSDLHPVGPPGRQELPSFPAVPTTIHWEKQMEHFPIPTESVINLPTGSPVSIPKIQHSFNDETPDAKINREKRQAKVKEEFQKAWSGYKKSAWLHDELSPLSGNFRDPFCGWAATLVDTLDTLWIMGLHEEFEEAARAVNQIDFTTTPRSDIPMFETTIRYLGGLLAAYDISERKYGNLLDKAVELAEILIGAFDTPNRMPMLYYRWKPTFASQPHRASQRSNLAELGSLSLEFTRLAQLTKNHRYYDAVARITNALAEFQDRTKLNGVFPNNVDASGCNRTVPLSSHEPLSKGQGPAISPAKAAEEPEGFKPSMPKTVAEPRPKKKGGKDKNGPNALELQILPGEPTKAQLLGWGDNKKPGNSKRGLEEVETGVVIKPKRELEESEGQTISNKTSSPPPTDPITGLPLDLAGAKSQIGDSLGDWDCASQGLETSDPMGFDKFSMGGGQDSTYEYFPKQYLLLGGREDKYRQMYLKTIEAVRKWMLYRPMVPGSNDILFSGSVTTGGKPETDLVLNAEVEHLTCFISGMIGMGAKIFSIKGDLELAIKLADGCVWAYESTPSGIMAEGATVLPCESAEQCTWNETAYFEYLDPMASERDNILEEYLANKVAREAELETAKKATLIKAEADKAAASKAEAEKLTADKQSLTDDASTADNRSTQRAEVEFRNASDTHSLIQRRQDSPKNDSPEPVTHSFAEDSAKAKQETGGLSDGSRVPADKIYEEKLLSTEAELRGMAAGRQTELPPPAAQSTLVEDLPDPLQPLSHKDFVAARIKQSALPPGYVNIRSRKYILRPEAIESVWYMYRITGDSSWQDKGWKMFEAIIKATSAKYGHSAIYDVTEPETFQMDEMESFWLAETLKYFYLLFSTPDTISLDDWVLNTEAHPFRRDS